MFDVMLKSMGFDPKDFQEKFNATMKLVQTFDKRLQMIDQKLDMLVPFITPQLTGEDEPFVNGDKHS